MLNRISPLDIQEPPILDKSIFINIIEKITFLRDLFISAEDFLEQQYMPSEWIKTLEQYTNDYNGIIVQLEKLRSHTKDDQLHSELSHIRQKTDSLFNSCTTISSSNKFSQTFGLIASTAVGQHYNNIVSIKPDGILQISATLNEKLDSINDYITATKNKVDIFYDEIQKKAANLVVSDYAKIFGEEESKQKKSAHIWLGVAIGFSIIVLFFIILSFNYDWFHITETVTNTNVQGTVITSQIYNYPNLISKVLVISVLLYLISFFFKQFSISQHLKTVNNHRKNALNSYNNFSTSIGSADIQSRHALMLEVAKSIYDLGHTGYLPAQRSDSLNTGVVEFTKYIAPAKDH